MELKLLRNVCPRPFEAKKGQEKQKIIWTRISWNKSFKSRWENKSKTMNKTAQLTSSKTDKRSASYESISAAGSEVSGKMSTE